MFRLAGFRTSEEVYWRTFKLRSYFMGALVFL
jgi:hypothetical protein